MLISHIRALYDSKQLIKICRMSYTLQLLYIISLFQKISKFAKNSNLIRSSKKAQAVMRVPYRRALYNFKTIE